MEKNAHEKKQEPCLQASFLPTAEITFLDELEINA